MLLVSTPMQRAGAPPPTDADPSRELRGRVTPMLGILAQLFEARMSALLKDHRITYTQLATMYHLRGIDEAAPVGELAAAMQINQPGMSKVVKRLTDDGLTETSSSPTDARRKLVSITDRGRTLIDEVGVTLDSDVDQWFDGWQVDELGQFIGHVGRLIGWLDANRL